MPDSLPSEEEKAFRNSGSLFFRVSDSSVRYTVQLEQPAYDFFIYISIPSRPEFKQCNVYFV
jgi:hypothetical protein